MISSARDHKIRQALAALSIPTPLTVEALFEVMQESYPRPLELWRGAAPLPGLQANALWLTRPDHDSDIVWLDPALTGVAAIHSLSHEFGHQALGHVPLVLPAPAQPEPYEILSDDFLAGCLFGRARSLEGPQDPEHLRIEDEAEAFAYRLRRTAEERARDRRHNDPLVDRLHHSL